MSVEDSNDEFESNNLPEEEGYEETQEAPQEEQRQFPAEVEHQIKVIEFLKQMARDPYQSIQDASNVAGIAYNTGNAALKHFVLALTRAASDMDFPRRVLTFYNKTIEDEQYHLTVTDVNGLIPLVKEFKERKNVLKATKERQTMRENVILQDSQPRQNPNQGPVNPEQLAAAMAQVRGLLSQQGIDIPEVKVVNGQLTYDNTQNILTDDSSGTGQYPYHDETSLIKYFMELIIPITDKATRAKIPIFLKLFNAQRQTYWRNPNMLIRDLKMYFGAIHGESIYNAFDANKAYVTDDPAYMNRLTGVGRYDQTYQQPYAQQPIPPPMMGGGMDPMMGGMGMMGGNQSSPEERRLYQEITKNLQITNLNQLVSAAKMGGPGMGGNGGNGHSPQMYNYPQIIYGQDGRTYQMIPPNPETGQPMQIIPIGGGQQQNAENSTTAIVMKGLMDIVAANLTKAAPVPTDNGLADLTKTIITNMFTQQQHQVSPVDQLNQTLNITRQMQDFMGNRNTPPNPEVEIRKIESGVAIAKMNNDVRMSELEKARMEAENIKADQRVEGVVNMIGGTVSKVFETIGDKIDIGGLTAALLGGGLSKMMPPGQGQQGQGQNMGIPGGQPANMGNVPPGMNPAVIEQMRLAQMQEAYRKQQIAQTQVEAFARGEELRRQQMQNQSTIGVPTTQTITPPVQDVQASYEDRQAMRAETPEDVERAIANMSSEQLNDIAFRASQEMVQAESAVNKAKAELARRRNMGMQVENPYDQRQRFVPQVIQDMQQHDLEYQQQIQNIANATAQNMYNQVPQQQTQQQVSANEIFGMPTTQSYDEQPQYQQQPQRQEPPQQQEIIDDPERVHVGALQIGNRNINAGSREELHAQGQDSNGPSIGFPIPSTEAMVVNNPIQQPVVEEGDKKSSRYVAPEEVVYDENEVVEE